MHPQLERVAREFRAVTERFHRLMDATPDDRWGVRAAVDAWSVAECIAHLNLTSAAMVPRLRAAWETARARGGGAPRRYRRAPMGLLLSLMVGPTPGVGRWRFGRIRTPAPFVPGGALPRAEVVREFEAWQADELALVSAANGLPIDAVRIESPFAEGVTYDGYSSLLILARHEHRHLAQAERVWG